MTEEGKVVYRYAVEIQKNLKAIRNFQHHRLQPQLSICCMPSRQIAVAIADFCSRQKSVQLEFWEGCVNTMIRRIHRRESEIGFVYITSSHIVSFKNHIASKGMRFTQIATTPLVLFVGPNHPLANAQKVTQQDLSDLRFIQYFEDQYSLYSHLGHLREEVLLENSNQCCGRTNSDHLMTQMLLHTDLCSIGSSFMLGSLDHTGIRTIPIESSEDKVVFGYIKRKNDTLSHIAEQFLNYFIPTAQGGKPF